MLDHFNALKAQYIADEHLRPGCIQELLYDMWHNRDVSREQTGAFLKCLGADKLRESFSHLYELLGILRHIRPEDVLEVMDLIGLKNIATLIKTEEDCERLLKLIPRHILDYMSTDNKIDENKVDAILTGLPQEYVSDLLDTLDQNSATSTSVVVTSTPSPALAMTSDGVAEAVSTSISSTMQQVPDAVSSRVSEAEVEQLQQQRSPVDSESEDGFVIVEQLDHDSDHQPAKQQNVAALITDRHGSGFFANRNYSTMQKYPGLIYRGGWC